MQLTALVDEGAFAPSRIAAALRTTLADVAVTVGLNRDALARTERARSAKTQKRLREMVEILNRVEPRFGSTLLAYTWYRSEPLAGFGGLTAMQLAQNGQAADVLAYIDSVDSGVHA